MEGPVGTESDSVMDGAEDSLTLETMEEYGLRSPAAEGLCFL